MVGFGGYGLLELGIVDFGFGFEVKCDDKRVYGFCEFVNN